jgi:hypothetical protein
MFDTSKGSLREFSSVKKEKLCIEKFLFLESFFMYIFLAYLFIKLLEIVTYFLMCYLSSTVFLVHPHHSLI